MFQRRQRSRSEYWVQGSAPARIAGGTGMSANVTEKWEKVRIRHSHRHPPVKNINQIQAEKMTTGQRVADKLATVMGSWAFIIIQSIILTFWITLNVIAYINHWDPYPFILLNLALSFQAAYAAPIIMMSQNRQAAKDRLQAELDLNTNLKAELLIEELHGSVDELRMQKWTELLDIQQRQIDMLQNVIQQLETAAAR